MEENIDDENQIQVHPFHIPQIVELLVQQYCSPKELAPFRLVSTDWNDISLAHFRSISKLIFQYENRQEVYLLHRGDSSNSENCTSLQDFLDFVTNPLNKCQTKPYRQIELRRWNFGVFDFNLNRQFWALLGSHLTSMTLRQCDFKNVEEFRTIIYQVCPNLRSLSLIANVYYGAPIFLVRNNSNSTFEFVDPAFGENRNLKELTISYRPKVIFTFSDPIPVSWMELLSHFNQLTSFKLHLEPEDLEHSYNSIADVNLLKTIKGIRQHDPAMLPLTTLEIGDKFAPSSNVAMVTDHVEQFYLLMELNLPQQFKELVLCNVEHIPVMNEQFVRDFLHQNSTSLESIFCKFSNNGGGEQFPRWNFPFGRKLLSLESLSMCESFCRNLEFLADTKKLRKFDLLTPLSYQTQITNVVSRTLETDKVSKIRLENLKEFICEYKLAGNEEDVEKLTRWFPNVQEVEMHLNDGQFQIICENWRQLKELKVYGNDLTDAGVLGREFVQDNDNDDDEGINGGENYVRPNITFLKDLTSFNCKNGKLTEDSVVNGLLKLPKLQQLFLSHDLDLSDETKQAVEKKLRSQLISHINMMIGD